MRGRVEADILSEQTVQSLFIRQPRKGNCIVAGMQQRHHRDTRRAYIPVLSKALRILELLHSDNRLQSIESLYAQTQFSRFDCYRILKVLAHHGYIAQTQDSGYRLKLQPTKLKFRFANLSAEHRIANVIESSLSLAASSAGIALVVLEVQ